MSSTIQFSNNIELSKNGKALRQQRLGAYARRHKHNREKKLKK